MGAHGTQDDLVPHCRTALRPAFGMSVRRIVADIPRHEPVTEVPDVGIQLVLVVRHRHLI
jgi:hypothetical protein